MPGWIKVEDQLPENYEQVLCWYLSSNDEYYYTIGCYSHKYKMWDTDIDGNECAYGCKCVTHWMPLPKPPNK